MTTLERWPRVREIAGAALACSPETRDAFLENACSADNDLRTEVDSLLAAYSRSDDSSATAWEAPLSTDPAVPSAIGPYRLLRELGVGGMGQVWLAEQTEPVRRLVALKLIRSGFYDPEITQRFLAERQSLALMNHPSIAKVFDAGTTPAGQPYLVMEYVDGCPITDYCDRNQLSIAQRLRLFQLVCDGVQHAHQKAIIHRDLKPSNILITEVDGKPAPRIIDFGIAKAMAQSLDAERTLTRVGSLVGTLGYMSPEQAEGGSDDIDTRSDVYALGIVLYQLLTGELPFDQKNITWYEALRQLREEEAPRPSDKFRTARVRLSSRRLAAAHNRTTEAAALDRQLRGDLDSIALKAIEKDRDRRYDTPSALAADIEHFLQNEPVTAHAAGVGYLARKYVRRHRVGVLVAAAAALLLVGFAIAQTWQLRNTRRQRDRADRITDFMTNMFKVSDPSESRGSTVTAREILDGSSHQIESGLGFDTTVQEQLMQVMANTYSGLGLFGRAHDLAQRVLDNRLRLLGPEDPKTLASMAQMAEILDRQGRIPEAQILLQKTIAMESRLRGPEDSLTLQSEEYLASILTRHAHYMEAEKLARQIIPIETRKLGATHPLTFASTTTLASALGGQSRFAEAETLYRRLMEEERRTFGPNHPDTLVAMHNLANMLADQGRYPEAESLYRETLAVESRVLGPDHPDTASTISTLANTVGADPARKADAEALYRRALAIELRVVGPDHIYTTQAKEGLANVLASEQHAAEAQQLLQEVLATRQRTVGPDNYDTLLTGYNLANVYLRQGFLPEAEKLGRATLERQTRVLDKDDPDTLASETLVARVLLKEQRPAEAEQFAQRAFDSQLRLLGPQHHDTQESLTFLAEALARQGRYGEARALYVQTIEKMPANFQDDVSDAWYNLADLAASTGHADDAFAYLHRAIQAGYHDAAGLRIDDAWKPLRKDARYTRALAAMQAQAPPNPAKTEAASHPLL